MGKTVINQAYLFFIYVISGLLIGILFDIFRVFRRSFRTSDFITYIQDILFWIITGVFLIYILFRFSSGEIRIYNIIGIVLGFSTYIIFFSRYFIKINVTIVKFLKKILKKIIRIVLYPLKVFFKIINKIIKKIFKPFTFFVINLKKNCLKSINKQKIIKKLQKNKQNN